MADKITLATVSELQAFPSAAAAINSNSAIITAAIDNTLSLDGSQPNSMEANLDMNSNRILNLPAPVSNLEPARLVDLETLTGSGTITINPLPTGGTTGQSLVKNSNSNFDAKWSTIGVTGPSSSIANNIVSFSNTTGQNFTDSGYSSVGVFNTIIYQRFVANGTYTPSVGLVFAEIECIGGGGGGGGSAGQLNLTQAAGGGGSGGYSKSVVVPSQIGVSKVVTIGLGGFGSAGFNTGGGAGQTSVGSLCIANGGAGGNGAGATSVASGGAGGAAGTGSIIAVSGIPGSCGAFVNINNGDLAGGNGGALATWGSGGIGVGSSTNGNSGTGFGAGASGGSTRNTTGATTGGNGTAGIVLIKEYCNQ